MFKSYNIFAINLIWEFYLEAFLAFLKQINIRAFAFATTFLLNSKFQYTQIAISKDED